jgi:hypothetical protein
MSVVQWDYKDQQAEKDTKAAKAKAAHEVGEGAHGSGFLSLGRVADLHDMSVDLSQQLKAKSKPLLPPQPVGVIMGSPTSSGKKYTDPPTATEERRWERSRGYVKRGNVMSSIANAEAGVGRLDAERVAQRATEVEQYEHLRAEYNLWTTVTAAVCFGAVYAFYTKVCLTF